MAGQAQTAKLSQLLRRGYEILVGTRRHTAEEMLRHAEKIERLVRAGDDECREGHHSGCIHVVLAAIEEA
jgi:hypothetical protein